MIKNWQVLVTNIEGGHTVDGDVKIQVVAVQELSILIQIRAKLLLLRR